MLTLGQRVHRYIDSHSLTRAGERVSVAVSGGADSVALLRLLLELRAELGLVLSVAHFHHGIRGSEADDDENFVSDLAHSHDLEFYSARGDAREFARVNKTSLETAARNLRYEFFAMLLREKKAFRVATAHTLDDQAETVLMKVLRGAGTRGLSGIFPEQMVMGGSIVRPLLQVRRQELREYLGSLQQLWREDKSNSDLSITRNRIRACVLPVLRQEANPATDIALAHLAEVSRGEEEYWTEQMKTLVPLLLVPGEPARGGGRRRTSEQAIALDLQKLSRHPLAVQRRVLRAAGELLGCKLDFDHVQSILSMVADRTGKGTQARIVDIANGWQARFLFRELRIERIEAPKKGASQEHSYKYLLPIPGEVRIQELKTIIRARICEGNGTADGKKENPAYNQANSIRLSNSSALTIRNWHAGDRFRPARHSSEKRVKELLYSLHLSPEQKQLWPLVAGSDCIVWVRGVDSPELRTAAGERLCIEESSE